LAEVRRFSPTERALHWVSAGAFFALALTGLVLWLPLLATAVDDRPLMRQLHLLSALGLVVGLAAVTAAGDRRKLHAIAREIDGFDADDRAWIRTLPVRLRRSQPAPPAGRLNAGQKLNSVLTAALLLLLLASGTDIWLGERDHALRLGGMLFLHDALTLAILALVCGHLYLVFLAPATQGSLSGMTRGSVDEAWARRHHPRWRPEDS